jgi:hypothetical protein
MIIRDTEKLLVASTGRYRFRLVMRVAKFADRLKTKAIQFRDKITRLGAVMTPGDADKIPQMEIWQFHSHPCDRWKRPREAL